VNILSLLALSLLGWYICKRLPKLSVWFVFTWLFLAPWTTHFSTQVINPSYAFIGAVLFFIGFMESQKTFSLGLWDWRWSNLAMGFGVAWIMQLHMSWLAFVPLLLYALAQQAREGRWQAVLFAFLGALPLLALLLPTYLTYGFNTHQDVQGVTTGLHWENVKDLFGTLARFLSLSSFELPRFIGFHTQDRLEYLLSSPVMLVPGFFLWAAGFIQVLGQLGYAFIARPAKKDWLAIKWLTLGVFFLLYGCFLFSPDMAASFRILLFFPIVMLYSFYIYDDLARRSWGPWLGRVFIACVVIFQVGYAIRSVGKGISIYAEQKEKMALALEKNDYHLVAERRDGSRY
jgi:hypothetical protein